MRKHGQPRPMCRGTGKSGGSWSGSSRGWTSGQDRSGGRRVGRLLEFSCRAARCQIRPGIRRPDAELVGSTGNPPGEGDARIARRHQPGPLGLQAPEVGANVRRRHVLWRVLTCSTRSMRSRKSGIAATTAPSFCWTETWGGPACVRMRFVTGLMIHGYRHSSRRSRLWKRCYGRVICRFSLRPVASARALPPEGCDRLASILLEQTRYRPGLYRVHAIQRRECAACVRAAFGLNAYDDRYRDAVP